MDYKTYLFTFQEKAEILLAGVAIMVVIAQLFYESWIVMIFTPVCIFLLQKTWRQRLLSKRRRSLMHQFQDAMQTVSNSLLSGSSIENAWKEAWEELVLLYGYKADMCMELEVMNRSMKLNIPIEQLLEDFARRADMEDITNFSEVFTYAKRNGGDLVGIIANTLYHIRAKQEAEMEIEVLVAAKKFEQNIMDVVPIGILLYLKLTSGDYLDSMYGNVFGVLFMTGCLAVYVAALLLADKILQIEV